MKERTMKRIFLASVGIWLLLVSVGACGEQDGRGKIAVATEGDTPAASVSRQAGSSPFFLLFDKGGTFVEAIKNPAQEGGMGQGGGKAVVDFLVDRAVKAIVAEVFGNTIMEYMRSKGIRPVAFKGNAAEAARIAMQSE